jgi:hypothetical protein
LIQKYFLVEILLPLLHIILHLALFPSGDKHLKCHNIKKKQMIREKQQQTKHRLG